MDKIRHMIADALDWMADAIRPRSAFDRYEHLDAQEDLRHLAYGLSPFQNDPMGGARGDLSHDETAAAIMANKAAYNQGVLLGRMPGKDIAGGGAGWQIYHPSGGGGGGAAD